MVVVGDQVKGGRVGVKGGTQSSFREGRNNNANPGEKRGWARAFKTQGRRYCYNQRESKCWREAFPTNKDLK